MGRICSADIILDTKLTNSVIALIVNQGATLGLQYHKYETGQQLLSINEALNIIIKELINAERHPWRLSGNVDFSIQNSNQLLEAMLKFAHFHEKLTRVALVSLSSPWCQDKSDDKCCTPDWDLYITLLLELCKDFAIIEISTHDEYFNWD